MWGRFRTAACAPSASCQGTHLPSQRYSLQPSLCTSSSPRPNHPAGSPAAAGRALKNLGIHREFQRLLGLTEGSPAYTSLHHRLYQIVYLLAPPSHISIKASPPLRKPPLKPSLSNYLDLPLVTQPALLCLLQAFLHAVSPSGSPSLGFSNQHLSAGRDNAHSLWG